MKIVELAADQRLQVEKKGGVLACNLEQVYRDGKWHRRAWFHLTTTAIQEMTTELQIKKETGSFVDLKAMATILDYLQEDFEDWTDEEKSKDRAVLDAYNKISKVFVKCFGTNVKPRNY